MNILLAILMAVASLGCSGKAPDGIVLGDERFDQYLPMLSGKRVAVFSNHSGIVGDRVKGSKLADALAETRRCFSAGDYFDKVAGIPFAEPSVPGGSIEYGPHLVDVLLEKGVDVKLILSPEHGFRGTADDGEGVSSEIDPDTGVEIFSLYQYGLRSPDETTMDKFDVLLVDIQDVGLRYYTYYVTMSRLMESCARSGKKVIVLDRPNPNGFYVDGPLLDMDLRSGVGWLPIPTVHGLTLGEMALMINGEGWLADGLECDLEVVPCQGYSHSDKYSLIVPPSPNLKDMRAVYLYSSTCYFEGTVVSLGRGTDWPFEVYGHPDMKDCSFTFTPRSMVGARKPMFQDEVCHGFDIRNKTLEEIWAEGIDLEYVVNAYRNLGMGESFFGKGSRIDRLAGVSYIREMILAGSDAGEIKPRWQDDVESFKALRRKYILYQE